MTWAVEDRVKFRTWPCLGRCLGFLVLYILWCKQTGVAGEGGAPPLTSTETRLCMYNVVYVYFWV
jgi:hypothetical protein